MIDDNKVIFCYSCFVKLARGRKTANDYVPVSHWIDEERWQFLACKKKVPNTMKRILIACGLVFGIAAFLLAFLLVQNSIEAKNPLWVLTPEEIAVRHAKEMTVAGFHIDPNTVEAIQQIDINDLVLVLVQYSGYQIDGDAELCEMVLEVKYQLLNQWEANGGAGLCHKINDPLTNVPISIVSSYGTTTLLDRGYSTAFGYLRNEEINKVVVTWEDGLKQTASIVERTYLAAREGGFHVDMIETYNYFGEIIFESNYPDSDESNP